MKFSFLLHQRPFTGICGDPLFSGLLPFGGAAFGFEVGPGVWSFDSTLGNPFHVVSPHQIWVASSVNKSFAGTGAFQHWFRVFGSIQC